MLFTGGVSINPRVFRFTDLIARIFGLKDFIKIPFSIRLFNFETLLQPQFHVTKFIIRPYRHTILNHSRGKGSSSTGVIAVISAKIKANIFL